MSSFMYVVECCDKTWYTGYTTDIVRRIRTHNAKKGAKYLKLHVQKVYLRNCRVLKKKYIFY